MLLFVISGLTIIVLLVLQNVVFDIATHEGRLSFISLLTLIFGGHKENQDDDDDDDVGDVADYRQSDNASEAKTIFMSSKGGRKLRKITLQDRWNNFHASMVSRLSSRENRTSLILYSMATVASIICLMHNVENLGFGDPSNRAKGADGKECPASSLIYIGMRSQRFHQSLVVSLAIIFPILVEVIFDHIRPVNDYSLKRDGILTRTSIVLVSVVSDIVLYYSSSAGDASVGHPFMMWSTLMIHETFRIAAIYDFLQRYGSPSVTSVDAILMLCIFILRALKPYGWSSGLTQSIFSNFSMYWRTASISLNIAPFVLITIHFFKFLAVVWSKSQTQTHMTVEEQYCFKYISAVYFCFSFYLAFHLIFGPVYICDFDTMYLSVYSHISAAFAFIVCMVHNRIEKQIVQNIHHALEMKRLFVRYVSHEIRTPMNTVSTGLILIKALKNTSVVCPDPVLGSMLENMFIMADEVQESCNVAVSILDDLLLYEKLEGGILSLDTNVENARSVIISAVHPFGIQAREKNIRYMVVFDEENGLITEEIANRTGRSPLMISVDGPKLKQVLRNLVSNAIKFSPSGSEVVVHAEVIHWLGMLRVSVEDSGAGLSVEHQTKLFKSIIQFNASKLQGGKGSGLGLYISKGIMDLHKGRIGVFSRGEGKGCTFHIDIPIGSPSESLSSPDRLSNVHDDDDDDDDGDHENENGSCHHERDNDVDHTDGYVPIRRGIRRRRHHDDHNNPSNHARDLREDDKAGGERSRDGGTHQDGIKTKAGGTNSSNISRTSHDDRGGYKGRGRHHQSTTDSTVSRGTSVDTGNSEGVYAQSLVRQKSPIVMAKSSKGGVSRDVPSITSTHHPQTNNGHEGQRQGEMSQPQQHQPPPSMIHHQQQRTTISMSMSEYASRSMNMNNGSDPSLARASNTATSSSMQPSSSSSSMPISSASMPISSASMPISSASMPIPSSSSSSSSMQVNNTSSNDTNQTTSSSSSSVKLPEKDPPALDILIVDDSPATRKMMTRLLQMTKICLHPHHAEDGSQAVTFIKASMAADADTVATHAQKKQKTTMHNCPKPTGLHSTSTMKMTTPDAIIMDFEMPVMNGPSATRHIRALGYTGIIIGVTGNALQDDMTLFLNSGADDICLKPVDIEKLKSKFAPLLANKCMEMIE